MPPKTPVARCSSAGSTEMSDCGWYYGAETRDDSCLVLYKYETVSDATSRRYCVYYLIKREKYLMENDEWKVSKRFIYLFFKWVNFINITSKFWKHIGSSKLIRHPRWVFFAPVNSARRGVHPPPSICRLQLLCQCFSKQCEDRGNNLETDWWDLYMQIL